MLPRLGAGRGAGRSRGTGTLSPRWRSSPCPPASWPRYPSQEQRPLLYTHDHMTQHWLNAAIHWLWAGRGCVYHQTPPCPPPPAAVSATSPWTPGAQAARAGAASWSRCPRYIYIYIYLQSYLNPQVSLPPPPYPRPAPAPGARCHTPNSGWLWSEQQFLLPLQNVIYEFVYLHLHLIVFFIYWPQDTDIGCSVQFSRLPFWYFICLYLHLIVSRLSFKHFVCISAFTFQTVTSFHHMMI